MSNLCDVQIIGKKYSVTWKRHITGLSVYSDRVHILLDMIVKDAKSYEVGIILSSGYVLWLSYALLATLDLQTLADYVRQSGNVKNFIEIEGAVFDNIHDVNKFTTTLEKKYIWHVLKK